MGKTTFKRDILKYKHPELIQLVQHFHVMGPEIDRELFIDNKPVKGLCHTRSYFSIYKIHGDDMYVNYIMDHIILDVKKKGIGRTVQEVTIYDTYVEFECDKVKELSSVHPSQQTGLNYN